MSENLKTFVILIALSGVGCASCVLAHWDKTAMAFSGSSAALLIAAIATELPKVKR